MPLHGHDLGGLMLQCVEAVHVASENLNRRDDRSHPHRHAKHLPRMQVRAVAQQMPGAHRTDYKGSGQIGGYHRMDEPVGEAGVEDDRQPGFPWQETAIG